MKRKVLIGFLIISVGLLAAGCKKKTQVKGLELSVVFSEPALSDNLIADVGYTWKTTGDFIKLDKDYNIFVRFWHGSNALIQDDHVPEIPTSKWEQGKEYTVKRRIYIPAFIDEFDPQFKGEETLRLSVGLYNPYDRTGQSEREVLSKKLKVTPPPLGTPEVIYESGWYDLEVNANSALKQWRWTAREAKCVIDNPKRDALLVIKGGVNISAVRDQKLTFKINDLVLDEFIAPQELFEKSYNIKKEMLGDANEFYLTIAADPAWIPAKVIPNSADERELGAQISFIYFR